jgi:hypothetical protein
MIRDKGPRFGTNDLFAGNRDVVEFRVTFIGSTPTFRSTGVLHAR